MALWTDNPRRIPEEWVEVILCRDVYHCTPSELAKQDWGTVQLHLALLKAESETLRLRGKG